MRSFFISIPPNGDPPPRVLLFLHGFGEAFDPRSDEPGAQAPPFKELGAKNLFRHGVPQILSDPRTAAPAGLPLFDSFVTIAPQHLQRADMTDRRLIDQMMDRACTLARALAGEPRIAIMGFSMGGFAAFLLAGRPEVRAVVAMDAAPAQGGPLGFAARVSGLSTPYWSFFTDYTPPSRFHGAAAMNEAIVAPDVPFGAVPRQAQCKTWIPTEGSDHEKHAIVCRQVCRSPPVYQWMLRYL